MRCKQIIEKLEQRYPLNLAASWDNPGMQIGDTQQEIHTVYLALDATEEVIEHAVREGVDLLITHHPMIFSGLKAVTADHLIGRRVMRLIKEGICCYAIHTNYDVAEMGALSAEYLGLKSAQVLSVSYCDPQTDRREGYGRVGNLEREMTLKEYTNTVKRAFSLGEVKVFGNAETKVKRVAILPGAGKSMISDAIRENADLMITGDIDHHTGIDAAAQGLCVIDAGHYGTEHIFIEQMKQELESTFPDLTVKREPFGLPFWIG